MHNYQLRLNFYLTGSGVLQELPVAAVPGTTIPTRVRQLLRGGESAHETNLFLCKQHWEELQRSQLSATKNEVSLLAIVYYTLTPRTTTGCLSDLENLENLETMHYLTNILGNLEKGKIF